jgi:hypothetical protein
VTRRKIVQFVVEWLLRAGLLAGLIPLAVVLDMHYAAESTTVVRSGPDVPLDEIGVWFLP